MKRHQEVSRQKVFGRRAAVLGGFKLMLVGALCSRLYQLQVVENQIYGDLAESNRINIQLVPPPRGKITDRFGRLLARNRKNYRVLLTTENIDLKSTLDALSLIVPLTQRDRRRILRAAKRRRGFVPIEVKDDLTWEQVSQIEINAIDLPGVRIDAGLTRDFPQADAAAHIVGYVSAVSETDQATDSDPLLLLPGFRIGKSGVEKWYDRELRGEKGSRQVEVNARGRILQELSHDPGIPGKQLVLTVDMDLQRFCLNQLARHKSASAVVMDIHTGDLLALASWPTFDPNVFSRGITAQEWGALENNELAPLTNKAMTGQFSPGSVFKMVVSMALLEDGHDPLERVTCTGVVTEGRDGKFHCWKRRGHGAIDMKDAIIQSCDSYFYVMSRKLGIDKIAAMARRLGYGAVTGLDLPNEAAGLVPTKAWKTTALNQPWTVGETLVASIGQGYVLCTPLQSAVMVSRLVNGGRAVVPHIAQGLIDDQNLIRRLPTDWPHIGLPDEHQRLIREAMDRVVLDRRGTAYGARILNAGMAMGGKTGTSQVRRITEAERRLGVTKNEDLPWHRRDHALFSGYGPLPDPRYAVSVVVEHGGSGSRIAAPIARDIMIETLRRDPSRRDGALKLAAAGRPVQASLDD